MLSDAWIGQHRTECFHHPRELSWAGLLETRGLNWGRGVEGYLAMLGYHNQGVTGISWVEGRDALNVLQCTGWPPHRE